MIRVKDRVYKSSVREEEEDRNGDHKTEGDTSEKNLHL